MTKSANKIGLIIFSAIFVAIGCSKSPTAPSAPPIISNPGAVVPPVVTPPVTTPPVVSTPVPNPLLSDARYSPAFYQQFALGAHDFPGSLAPLRRHLSAIQFYVMTVDNRGNAIDTRTLDATAAALINTTPIWNGGLGVRGLTYGTAQPAPVGCLNCGPDPLLEHNISVVWDSTTTNGLCARSDVGGNTITVYLRASSACTCLGLAVAPVVIKHELGHTMGYWHTDSTYDVMGASGTAACDLNPSAREAFHAKVAYSMPNGSSTP